MSRFDVSVSARKVGFALPCPVLLLAALTIPMELAEQAM